MKNISIKAKVLIIVLSTILLVTSVVTIEAIISINDLSSENINSYREKAYENRKESLKNYVKIAQKTIETYHKRSDKEHIEEEVKSYIDEQSNFLFSIITKQYEEYKDIMDENQLQELILTTIKSTRYGKNGYFWINDFDYKIVMHPIKSDLENKYYKNSKEVPFVSLAVNALKNQEEAHIQYSFYSPSSKEVVEKVSTIKVFKPFNWIIGTGSYIDDLTSKMQKEAKLAISGMRYGKDGYFWINNSKSIMLMHAINPSIVNKDFTNIRDKNGLSWINKGTEESMSKGDSFVEYLWTKPNSSKEESKLSYMYYFKPWDWVIGTGIYVSDIEEEISLMKENSQNQINSIIITVITYALITSILCFFLITFISTKYIVKPIRNFQEGLLQFFKYINRESNDVIELNDSSNDEIGLMSKLVNENILKTKSSIEEDREVIKNTIEVLAEFEQGDLCQRVTTNSSNPALQELTKLLNNMGNNIENNIDDVLTILEQYSSYNYLNKVKTSNVKEHLLKLANGVNLLGDAITSMLVENKSNGIKLQNSSGILLDNVQSLNISSNEAAVSLEQTAASLEEMTSNISSNTQNVIVMSNHANEVTKSVLIGQSLANETTKAMDEINVEVSSINDAITVIDQIAFQTNILSLNAAVEAATAGEAGKGFAVVAGEVRNLANKSAEAANVIKKLVENATQKANNGKKISDEMIGGYNHLNETISQTIELISDVEAASKEQLQAIEQINDAVALLDQKTQDNANVANTTSNVANDTQTIANRVVNNANKKEFRGK